MRKYRFHLVFALCWAIGSMALLWLFGSEDSPFGAPSSGILNALALVHIVPFILTYIVSGLLGKIGPCGPSGGDTIYWGLVFTQWFLVGLVIGALIQLVKGISSTNK